MKYVYVLSAGCIYEGGSVKGVFLREDLAIIKYDEMITENRKHNLEMDEWDKEQFVENGYKWGSGRWLTETVTIEENARQVIFYEMHYVILRRYECEE